MKKRTRTTGSAGPKPTVRGKSGVRGEGVPTAPEPDDDALRDPQASSAPERTVLALIRDIREGRMSGPMLHKDDRLRVVEHLTAEGYSGSEIAEVLKVSERTIIRDRIAVRELNALVPSPEMVGQVVGHLVRTAEQVTGRLRRIGREAGTKPSEKIESEKAVWQVQRELVITLQGIGYMPTAPTHLNAHITSGNDLPEAQALLAEIERLESLPELRAADGTPIVSSGLADLRGKLTRSIVAEQLNSMTQCGKPGQDFDGSGGVDADASEGTLP